MSEQELREFRQAANWFMQKQMEQVQKDFGLAAFQRFDWSPWRGELVFSTGGVPKVVARVQVVGTFSPKGGAWHWAWANPTLPEPVRREVLRVRQYGEERTLLMLMQPKWAAKEADAWQMTAITDKMLDAKGAFKCPGQDLATFMVFTEIRTVSDRTRIFGARMCSHVLDEGRPILLVSMEQGGEVLALCGGEDDSPAAAQDIPLDKLLALDPSLNDLAGLPQGWVGLRESPDQDWVRSKAE
jgi:hypothetical protein